MPGRRRDPHAEAQGSGHLPQGVADAGTQHRGPPAPPTALGQGAEAQLGRAGTAGRQHQSQGQKGQVGSSSDACTWACPRGGATLPCCSHILRARPYVKYSTWILRAPVDSSAHACDPPPPPVKPPVLLSPGSAWPREAARPPLQAPCPAPYGSRQLTNGAEQRASSCPCPCPLSANGRFWDLLAVGSL